MEFIQSKKLKKSFASRHAYIGAPEPYNVKVTPWPAPWKVSDQYINFSFDIGRKVNEEIIHLRIHKSDYGTLMQTMLEIDREAAITAFAQAVIAVPPKS
ncbi:hypothetical protein HFO27_13465 [Rhizobium leguminosarum]|uniref:hypothetical protein n=1 Tax=Rhizobium leguminosarum TaxID=384 RepID=UPI001C91AEE0|nr:hypothetical protein [Rhizobium leguminosarum]MBY3175640.1 hypothetical protein [Rhizobium leguminosarum]